MATMNKLHARKIFLSCFLRHTSCFLLSLTPYVTAHAQAGQWTWMKGDSTSYASGVFGTQGIPSLNNNPPGFYEPSEWKGKDGTFWCYSGWHSAVFNDVWRYNIQTNEW